LLFAKLITSYIFVQNGKQKKL